jgi:hypothetical protein
LFCILPSPCMVSLLPFLFCSPCAPEERSTSHVKFTTRSHQGLAVASPCAHRLAATYCFGQQHIISSAHNVRLIAT